MKIECPAKVKPLWQESTRYAFLRGGRGSGKSWSVADYIIAKCVENPDLSVVCLRQVQKSIKHSSKKLLEDRIRHHGLQDLFEITLTEIRRKGGSGIMIFNGLQDHTADSIKSLENFSLCWVEEAQTITQFSMDLLVPTIRSENSRLIFTYNPRLRSDAVEVLRRQKKDKVDIFINYTENPFCPKAIIEEAEEMRKSNPDKYRHIYLGDFESDDEKSIISRKWALAAVDAHRKLGIEPSGIRKIGYDPADSGADANAAVFVHGNIVLDVYEWSGGKDELFDSAEKVAKIAKIHKADLVVYDNIGVGAGTGSNLKKIGVQFEYMPFTASDSPTSGVYRDGKRNSDAFSNLKAQAWQHVADRMMATYNRIERGIDCDDDLIISIDNRVDHIDQLIDELSAPGYDYDNRGRMKVESKKDLEKRGIPSPNLADAFVMAVFPLVRGAAKSIKVRAL